MKRLEEKLKTEKLRLTEPRKIIFGLLMGSDKALSAQEVCTKMSESAKLHVDQASVYRNLILFTDLGLVHRLHSGKYAVCQHDKNYQHNHIHVVASCFNCGKTYEVQSHGDQLCELAGKFKDFIDEFSSFKSINLQGNCNRCSNSKINEKNLFKRR